MNLIRKNSYINKQLSIKDFYEKRNKVLIVREIGGLGDILIHRQMFEDFKAMMPDCELHFACPSVYHDALDDHPFIDKIHNSRDINIHDFIISYNTTNACCKYEIAKAPYAEKNRSDIWANHCGVELNNHNMHIKVNDENKLYAKKVMLEMNSNPLKPIVVVCPKSAMQIKDLTRNHLELIIKQLKDMNCFVYILHHLPLPEYKDLNIPIIYGQSIKKWISLIDASDYVISVDTASFHLAGGIKKPLTGIFTFADGKVYGKYYNFELVQKHRDDGDWSCGPCYNWIMCPKTKDYIKPCLTEITNEMMSDGIIKMFNKWPWKHKVPNLPIKLNFFK